MMDYAGTPRKPEAGIDSYNEAADGAAYAPIPVEHRNQADGTGGCQSRAQDYDEQIRSHLLQRRQQLVRLIAMARAAHDEPKSRDGIASEHPTADLPDLR